MPETFRIKVGGDLTAKLEMANLKGMTATNAEDGFGEIRLILREWESLVGGCRLF